MQLTFVVEDNVLKITEASKANNRLITDTYPVGDLYRRSFIVEDQPIHEKDATRDLSSKSRSVDLLTLIARTIEPESWDDKQGLGSMTYVKESGSLVIRQTPSAHEQIRQLLRDLREGKQVGHGAPEGEAPYRRVLFGSAPARTTPAPRPGPRRIRMQSLNQADQRCDHRLFGIHSDSRRR